MIDPKINKKRIEEEFNNYIKTHVENNLADIILYFEDMLNEFYDNLSFFLFDRYDGEKIQKNTLNYYLDSFYMPHCYYLYKNILKETNSGNEILDKIIFETRKEICCFSSHKCAIGTEYSTEQNCSLSSLILQKQLENENNIYGRILATNLSFGIPNREHAFTFVTYKDKKYIIDCTFSQFTKLFYMSSHILKIPFGISPEPAYFLLNMSNGKELLNQLLNYGYFEATDENIKKYLDSFVLSSRNAYYYLNNPKASFNNTGIDAKYYVDSINNMMFDKGDLFEPIMKYEYSSPAPIIYGFENELGKVRGKYLTKKQIYQIDQVINNKK